VSDDVSGGCAPGLGSGEIAAVWPPITPNLHRLAFEAGRVQWLLVPMPLTSALRELVATVDVYACTATATTDDQAARRHAKALARLAGAGASVFFEVGALDEPMRHALRSAGFAPPSTPDRPNDGLDRWRYAPRFTPRQALLRGGANAPASAPTLIVGAGLAGCAMAWALAEQGRDSVVFEQHCAPAMETSGNPAGLFHGIVNPQDGAHARFNRAAALEAQRAVRHAMAHHGVAGEVRGLLRLERGTDDALHAMRATLARLALPSNYVQVLSAAEASVRCGLALTQPAWWYPGGGWVHPGGLAHSFLLRAAHRVTLRTRCAVQSLTRESGRWQLRDARGEILGESGVVVLANAGDALRLLRPWLPASQPDAWPLQRVRGQISIAEAGDCMASELPRVPITGAGYLLPAIDGRAIFGASSQVGDDDPSVRDSDHRHNLDQLSRLTGGALRIDPSRLSGRTGWRWSTDDRLPVLGAVPDMVAVAQAHRLEQPAHVPRLNGLYACTAFSSRGITWAALAAQVVAASITGAPLPIEAGLLDSLDAARFVVREAARRSRRGG
jgi:tRNA 5-methylaminomethyl-2-thiouridine biosynthesis bifunctional protein